MSTARRPNDKDSYVWENMMDNENEDAAAMNTKPIHHQLDRMHEATMHGSIEPVDIYWLISEHGRLVNEHDQTVLKLAIAEAETAALRRQLAWTPVAEVLPENNVRVLAVLATLRPTVIIAWYVRARTLRAEDANYDASDDFDADYDEATDAYFVPDGWYEDCESGSIYYRCSDAVTHWRPLPDVPTRE